MTMLSPAATYHAELREQLGTVGRTLSVQRAFLWLARGIAAGTVVVLGLVIWAWLREGGVGMWPLPVLIGVPLSCGVLAALATLCVRQSMRELARRVDRAARLNERSTTALELGARGDEFPLALAQMRDAVEHLQRVDLLEAFPLAVPRKELLTTFFVVLVAVLIAVSPNPWLLRARASNPAITIAREQAQRVQRLADTIPADNSPELDALRTLIAKGARTVDARSTEPDAALNAMQDIEDQVRQMSAGDDQLAAALAAVASALASDPTTQTLSSAINTGDMRQIAQAARDLAHHSAGLSGQDQQRVSKVLRDAAGRAGRVSQSVAAQLNDAANALAAASGADAGGTAARTGTSGQGQAGDSTQAASEALNNLADSAATAGERQRAASQLESGRNALERALGRTQSRSGTSGRASSSGNQRNTSTSGGGSQGGDPTRGGGQGQSGVGSSEGTDGSGSAQGGEQSTGSDQGQGTGYSTGGQNQNRTGPATSLDTITTPQQVPGNGAYAPDESMTNPYLGDAASGSAQAPTEKVQPAYSRKPTSGNDSGSIPMGLRDLVKDYFSSLDQK